MKYCLDSYKYQAGNIICTGWAVPENKESAMKVKAADSKGNIIRCSVNYAPRPDAAQAVYNEIPSSGTMYGFSVSIPYQGRGSVSIICSGDNNDSAVIEIKDAEKIYRSYQNRHCKLGQLIRFIKSDNKKDFWMEEKIEKIDEKYQEYALWKLKKGIDKKEKKRQSEDIKQDDPLISIVIPVYRPDKEFLKMMIESVINQTYERWELCLACALDESEDIKKFLMSLSKIDERVKVFFNDVNEGISVQTNFAIENASGTWIAFADQDDYLSDNILYEYVKAVRYQKSDAVYCDEDKFETDPCCCWEPNFKPDFNPDLLCANNYICHMFMVRKSILEKTGLLRKEYDGAQDHDLILRCSEVTGDFVHIPKVLYSWRCSDNSTASNPMNKEYAYDAGEAAIDAHYSRTGISAKAHKMDIKGWYGCSFELKQEPLVSIIIPNKDHSQDLERCITSLTDKSVYKNIEIIIVENNSEEKETFMFYDRISAADPRVKILKWDKAFNYSAINNFAVKKATGDYILLLNNDTEVISSDFLVSMMGYAMRKDAGAVGAKLLYPDGTIQHAGVLVGVSEGADHVFLHYKDDEPGYMGRAIVSQDMSAVTGACLLTKKQLYIEAGGLDEEFEVAYNDVDYCLKLRSMGYYIIYDAYAKLYHYESKSRGYEDDAFKQERFEKEKCRLREKWPVQMLGDPYYNRNLSLKNGYYRI